MLTNAGSIAAIVGGSISVITLIAIVTRWSWRKHKFQDPFEVYYEPKVDRIEYSHTTTASSEPQQAQVTLRLKTDVHVEFVVFWFTGIGEQPRIKKLYEWNWGYGMRPSMVSTHSVIDQAKHYWEYDIPFQRINKERIRVGIEYQTDDSFSGELVVELKALEARRSMSLPFVVKASASKPNKEESQA